MRCRRGSRPRGAPRHKRGQWRYGCVARSAEVEALQTRVRDLEVQRVAGAATCPVDAKQLPALQTGVRDPEAQCDTSAASGTAHAVLIQARNAEVEAQQTSVRGLEVQRDACVASDTAGTHIEASATQARPARRASLQRHNSCMGHSVE